MMNTMMTIMNTSILICKNKEHEAKRFRETRKRLLTIPLSEKQSTLAARGFYMDV